MQSQLEQLKAMTCVVADTGDIDAIRQFRPVDATTNPSLLLKAGQNPAYRPLLEQARTWAQSLGGEDQQQLGNMTDRLAVLIGLEILKLIPGRISTEVDARLSFDTQATITRARKLIEMYLGRYSRRRAAGTGRYQLQPDPAIRLRPGTGLR
jgi:transaldolase